ncbi:nucleoside triphosphate pyrophosphohydrolase [Micromonospora sp. DT43]|uniref:nucleoside triphosphate pyrophosphohydrolase n=1 Tax=Micromonospora sp. DT43 TaxID=3393440 RepID=UPI003CFADF41
MAQIGRTLHGKLVRDRIPEIIAGNGRVPKFRVLPRERLLPALVAKLHEEAEELGAAGQEDVLGELADVQGTSRTAPTAAAVRRKSEKSPARMLPGLATSQHGAQRAFVHWACALVEW